MAFKQVQDLNADEVISLGGKDKKTGKAHPTSIVGFFLGSRQVKSPKSKTGFAAIHIFQTDKGNRGVWGKTDMDRKMLTVPTGTMTRITFSKMVPTPNGDMYTYTVEFDDENSIEVVGANVANTLESTSSQEADDVDYSEDSDENYADDSDYEAEVEAPPVRMAAPLLTAEQRRASVQAKLGKSNKR